MKKGKKLFSRFTAFAAALSLSCSSFTPYVDGISDETEEIPSWKVTVENEDELKMLFSFDNGIQSLSSPITENLDEYFGAEGDFFDLSFGSVEDGKAEAALSLKEEYDWRDLIENNSDCAVEIDSRYYFSLHLIMSEDVYNNDGEKLNISEPFAALYVDCSDENETVKLISYDDYNMQTAQYNVAYKKEHGEFQNAVDEVYYGKSVEVQFKPDNGYSFNGFKITINEEEQIVNPEETDGVYKYSLEDINNNVEIEALTEVISITEITPSFDKSSFVKPGEIITVRTSYLPENALNDIKVSANSGQDSLTVSGGGNEYQITIPTDLADGSIINVEIKGANGAVSKPYEFAVADKTYGISGSYNTDTGWYTEGVKITPAVSGAVLVMEDGTEIEELKIDESCLENIVKFYVRLNSVKSPLYTESFNIDLEKPMLKMGLNLNQLSEESAVEAQYINYIAQGYKYYIDVTDIFQENNNYFDISRLTVTDGNDAVSLIKDTEHGEYSNLYYFILKDEGTHRISAVYQDQAGNTAKIDETVIVDSDEPEIEFYYKNNNEYTKITEGVNEDVSVKVRKNEVYFKVIEKNTGSIKVNGREVEIQSEADDTYYKLDLAQGETAFTVSCTDKAVKNVTASINILYKDGELGISLKTDGKETENNSVFRSASQKFYLDFINNNSVGADINKAQVIIKNKLDGQIIKYNGSDIAVNGMPFDFELGEGDFEVKVKVGYDSLDNDYASKKYCFKIDYTPPSVTECAVNGQPGFFSSLYNALFFKDTVSVKAYIHDENTGVESVDAVCKSVRDDYRSCKYTDLELLEDGNGKFVEFNLPNKFCGTISLTSCDKAGNSDSYIYEYKDGEVTSNTVIADNIKPVISDIEYLDVNNNSGNDGDNFFTGNVTAKFTITEDFLNTDDESNTYISVNGNRFSLKKIYKSENHELMFGENSISCTVDETGSIYTIEIKLKEDNEYKIYAKATDCSGNYDDLNGFLYVDNDAPVISLTGITDYSSDYDNTITSDKDIKFSFKIEDSVSGIYSCYYKFTPVEEYTPAINSKVFSQDGRKECTLDVLIPSKTDNIYRGTLTVYAFDRSQNKREYVYKLDGEDSPTQIVVGRQRPEINVTFDNNSAVNNKYYKADRTAEIEIKSSAFDPKKAVITVNKLKSDGTQEYERNLKFSDLTYKYEIKNGKAVYTLTYDTFNKDGNYILTVNCSDMIGNHNDDTYQFVIDKTAPRITVAYNDKEYVRNGKYFNRSRVAAITVKEANFNSEDVVFSGKGYDMSNITWTASGEDIYTAKISFNEDNNYEFNIQYTDLAGNIGIVSAGDSAAPYEFTVDKTNPTGSIKIGSWERSLGGQVWENLFGNISFSLFSRYSLPASISSDDNLSGIDNVEYYISFEEKNRNELESLTNWSRGNSFILGADSQAVVYARITDKAGNATYINSDGIIIDAHSPEVERLAPVVTISPRQPVNGIYNGDVQVDISVKDYVSSNDVYSGLSSVSYRVLNNNSATQQGNLFSFNYDSSTKKTDLAASWSGNIVVDASKNNSNNVIIEVTAVDNCGNSTVSEAAIKIDVSNPTINVSYDNNTSDSTYKNYYKNSRTATITITERNFDPNLVNIDIKNTAGVIPAVGAWTVNENSNDPDATTHTATITYSADGDYTFDISCSDAAGNKAESADYGSSSNPASFTIDKTKPVITVEYDNNKSANGYFSGKRNCTITVKEHNFDSKRFNVLVTASAGGKNIAAPKIGSWKSSGDVHTAKIAFTADADYTLNVAGSDKAGNENVQFVKQSFTVDKTAPDIIVNGISQNSANNQEKIGFTVSVTDDNLSSAEVYLKYISYQNSKYIEKDLEPDEISKISKGKEFAFDNLEADGMYTLYCMAKDKSGNICTNAVVNNKTINFENGLLLNFSVNRNGSVFSFDETTAALNKAYIQQSSDIVIFETNVDEIKSSDTAITVFRDNEKNVLTSDQYTRELISGKGEWYQYRYVIDKDVFKLDGIYKVSVTSTDAAENISDSVNSGAELNFAVDKTNPICNVSDLKSNEVYNASEKIVKMNVTDNVALASVLVKINGEVVYECKEDKISEITKNNGSHQFTIKGNSGDSMNISISYRDMAGNENKTEFNNVRVTTSKWVLYYTNKPLFAGSVIALIALLVSAAFVIIKKVRNQ